MAWRGAHGDEVPAHAPIDWNRGGLLTVAAQHDRPDTLALALLLDLGLDPDERVRWGEGDEIMFFWNHIPWLSSAHPELDRGTYSSRFRLIPSGAVRMCAGVPAARCCTRWRP